MAESKEQVFNVEQGVGNIFIEEATQNFENQAEINGWVDFVYHHPNVKCKEYQVPPGILPDGYDGLLLDAKVEGKKRGPDDELYLASSELRAKVARGNCVLELQRNINGEVERKYIFFIFAMKKFSGGMGDEDDLDCPQGQWERYFIKDISFTKKVISTVKENGESAHIGIRRISGTVYFCIGSKNVHLFVRNGDDIEKYTEDRFEFARRIARIFFKTFLNNPEIEETKTTSLVQFMESTRYTVVAEILQPENQHVVSLDHLMQPELRFICWTKPDFGEDATDSKSLCAMPIDEGIEMARSFGLKAVDYEALEMGPDPAVEIDGYIENIRKDHGYEGKVLYFMDENNATIGIVKKKTAWYVLLRAIRERVATLISGKKSLTDDAKRVSLKERIGEIRQWFGFTESYANGWIELGLGFYEWVVLQKADPCKIRSNYAVVFSNFLGDNPGLKEKYHVLLNQYDDDKQPTVSLQQ